LILSRNQLPGIIERKKKRSGKEKGKSEAIHVFNWELCHKDVWGRKLHNEELHNLYPSPSIITIIKSRTMRWAEHVA
jgi:hypothetical protein